MVHVQDKRLVVKHSLEYLQKALLPCVIGLFALQSLLCVLHAAPFYKVVNILKMVIKGHAVDAAVLGDIVDCDFVERLFQQQIFE